MNQTQNRFAFLDAPFQQAEEAKAGGPVPDGDHEAEVESAELTDSKAGNPMVKWTLTVTSGECAGRNLFTQNMIPQNGDTREQAMKRLGFLKKNLKTAGVDVENQAFSLSTFITSQLSTLTGVKMKVTVSTQKDDEKRQNVYFNELISKPDNAEVFGGSGDREDVFKDN